jgi:hypothetical protein
MYGGLNNRCFGSSPLLGPSDLRDPVAAPRPLAVALRPPVTVLTPFPGRRTFDETVCCGPAACLFLGGGEELVKLGLRGLLCC